MGRNEEIDKLHGRISQLENANASLQAQLKPSFRFREACLAAACSSAYVVSTRQASPDELVVCVNELGTNRLIKKAFDLIDIQRSNLPYAERAQMEVDWLIQTLTLGREAQ